MYLAAAFRATHGLSRLKATSRVEFISFKPVLDTIDNNSTRFLSDCQVGNNICLIRHNRKQDYVTGCHNISASHLAYLSRCNSAGTVGMFHFYRAFEPARGRHGGAHLDMPQEVVFHSSFTPTRFGSMPACSQAAHW